MNRRIWGYIRVSTNSQNYEYQLEIMKQTGLEFNHIYYEKQTGKNFDRVQYQAMIGAICEGDLVVFPSLDRMGRNYDQIIEQWHLITRSRKCDIKILDMDMLDTTKSDNTLTNKFISDLVLQILSYVAEIERKKINARVRLGLENARNKGVTLGRPRVHRPENYEEIYTKYLMKEYTAKEAMNLLDFKKSTFYKILDEFKNKQS